MILPQDANLSWMEFSERTTVEGPVVFAFFVAMLATNFICRKVASWCLN